MRVARDAYRPAPDPVSRPGKPSAHRGKIPSLEDWFLSVTSHLGEES
jgi:hypothetical protein